MPRKKNPDSPGRGGHNRKSPMNSFAPVLKDLLRIATKNHYVLPKSCTMSVAAIRDKYGHPALTEYKAWFECTRRFDQDKADVIRSQLLRGDFDKPPKGWTEKSLRHYTPQMYAEWRETHTCFSPIWSVKTERWRDAYKLVTG